MRVQNSDNVDMNPLCHYPPVCFDNVDMNLFCHYPPICFHPWTERKFTGDMGMKINKQGWPSKCNTATEDELRQLCKVCLFGLPTQLPACEAGSPNNPAAFERSFWTLRS
jgi:hypothetical protein